MNRTDDEGRKWFSFFNITSETIPPRSCVFVRGRHYTKPNTEDDPPTSDVDGVDWKELSRQIRRGVCIVGERPLQRFGGTAYGYHGYGFTSGTSVPPRSWGKVTFDLPALARIEATGTDVDGNENLINGANSSKYAPTSGAFNLRSYNPNDSTYWSGWNWSPKTEQFVYWAVDIVEGMGTKSGLAWVMSASEQKQVGVMNMGLRNDNIGTGLQENQMVVSLTDSNVSSPFLGKSGGIYVEDGWVNINRPGMWSFSSVMQIIGRPFGLGAGGANPYAYLELSAHEDQDSRRQHVYSRYRMSPFNITIAPPMLTVGSGSTPSTFLNSMMVVPVQLSIEVWVDQGYLDVSEDRPLLTRFRFETNKTTNASSMVVSLFGDGVLGYDGTLTDREQSQQTNG